MMDKFSDLNWQLGNMYMLWLKYWTKDRFEAQLRSDIQRRPWSFQMFVKPPNPAVLWEPIRSKTRTFNWHSRSVMKRKISMLSRLMTRQKNFQIWPRIWPTLPSGNTQSNHARLFPCDTSSKQNLGVRVLEIPCFHANSLCCLDLFLQHKNIRFGFFDIERTNRIE